MKDEISRKHRRHILNSIWIGALCGLAFVCGLWLLDQFFYSVESFFGLSKHTPMALTWEIFAIPMVVFSILGAVFMTLLTRGERENIAGLNQTFSQGLHTKKRQERYGHNWEWREENVCIKGHWRSTSGNLVMIFPGDGDYGSQPCWIVVIEDDEGQVFAGKDAEDRAFAVAEAYTRQSRD